MGAAYSPLGKIETVLVKPARMEGGGELLLSGEVCTMCVEEKPAIANCKNCCRLLCEECLRQHKRQRDTMNHDIEESDSAKQMRKKCQCAEHDQEVKFYCCDCKMAICLHCTVTRCDGHKKNVAKDVKELLEQSLTTLKEKAMQFDSHFEHIQSVEDKNKTEVTRCEEEINGTFHEVISLLEDRKGQLTRQLHAANDMQQTYISIHKDNIREKLHQMRETIKSTEDLLKMRQESKLMIERDECLAKMEELAQLEWNTGKVTPTQWQMSVPTKEDYASKFGQILPKPVPKNIIVEMKERASIGQINVFTIRVEPLEQISRCNIDREISVKLVLTSDPSTSRSHGTLLNRTVKKVSENVWSVSYFPRSRGMLSIAVLVCGVEAHGSHFEQLVEDGIKKGDKVVRGSDWKWGDQDGGSGNVGEVIAVKENGWITVRWSTSRTKPGDYRWGKDGKFDVKWYSQ